MALFFFHFHDGDRLDEDELGIDLPSAERALAEAGDTAREMWPELLASRTDPRRCRFHIANEGGEELFVLPLAELLEGCLPGSPDLKLGMVELRQDMLETHRRAQLARSGISMSLDEVRQSLNMSRSLLERLNGTGNNGIWH